MKITIDTKEDSKEEIYRLIELLHRLVNTDNLASSSNSGSHPVTNAISEQPVSATPQENSLGDFFGVMDCISNNSNALLGTKKEVTQKEEPTKIMEYY